MKALIEMELNQNTLVIFSSDNGPANYAPARIAGSTAGLKGRKTDIFQGGVDVPFIMRWPGHIKAGQVDKNSVLSTIDLLPTFCELAGKKLPEDYKADGESFATLFRKGKFIRTKPMFWEWRFPYVGNDPYKADSWATLAVRAGNYKFLADTKRSRVELYDIASDPFEKKNLSNTNTVKVKELLNKWDSWKKELPQ